MKKYKPRRGRIIGCDGGYVNFGVGVIHVKGSKIRILGSGMLNVPRTSLLDAERKIERQIFRNRWIRIIKRYRPSIIIAERFQTRGTKTKSVEVVSAMNDQLEGICEEFGIRFCLVIASQWKNSYNRMYGKKSLEKFYEKLGSTKIPIPNRIPPHQIDAVFLACFAGLGHDFRTHKISKMALKAIGKPIKIGGTFGDKRKAA